jgi:hypothetical protein
MSSQAQCLRRAAKELGVKPDRGERRKNERK